MSVQNTLRKNPQQPVAFSGQLKPVTYTTNDGTQLTLDPQIVREQLVNGNGKVTDQEVIYFMAMCYEGGLNPLKKEAYLIKFGDKTPAQIIVSKDVYQMRAEEFPVYDGKESGVITIHKETKEKIYHRGECFDSESENLLGAWCEVHRKDRKYAEHIEVRFKEYVGLTSDGKINSNWQKRPAGMIRKVAVAHALREAFPKAFKGMYIAEEFGYTDTDFEDKKPNVIEAEVTEDASGELF